MATGLLDRARVAYEHGRWDDAYRAFHDAGVVGDLDVDDLSALADAAWWIGHNDESLSLCEQVYQRLVAADLVPQAAQVAVELGFLWLLRGEPTVGSGWVGRAARLLVDVPDSAAHGYLLYLEVDEARTQGDVARALELAGHMQASGTRHADVTLTTIGMVLEGVVLVRSGDIATGLVVLDEAMLPVHAGDVTPTWTGNLYCQLMALFIEMGDVPRARAWTDATERWCDGFSNAAMFLGICRVHRAQLLNLQGDWSAAEQCAAQACRDLQDMNVEVVAEGQYQIGELRRLRDDRDGAERAYVRAHELGRDPQPGLALLRLAQGRTAAARSSLDVALASIGDALERAPLLAARVEVGMSDGDVGPASSAARELTAIADAYGTPALVAAARQAAGTARLIAGEPDRALPLLREACRRWRALEARHDTACVRTRLAEALAEVGDREAADRERGLASAVFAELGAPRDLHLPERSRRKRDGTRPGGLSAREVEVLALVASGNSNREVAAALTISERTVERHLSNIFAKLDVSSRTEAAVFAFAHGIAGLDPG